MKALLAKIREILRNRKTRRLWVRVISLMACVVVFISTYALVLPAITMEIEASCGIEAHQHTDECYENVLVCGQEESEDHQHTDSCYEQVLVCGKEEHIHSTECYKEETDSETTAVATTQAASGSVILDSGEADASATENNGEEAVTGDSASSEGADSGDSYVDTTSEIENVPDETASDTDQYVPTLDPVYFNQVLNSRTGIYYYHVQPDETIADSAEITDWKKIEQNTADDTQLGKGDLLRVYLAYTIPAGSLNETNEVARYRLPGNLHLTDEQVEAINSTENGVAGQYIDYDTLEILDTDNYYRYLGAEAVEGTRTPSDDIEKYLSKHGGQEYISAVVRVENVYDEEGLYGEQGAYLGQDLVFTFTPYTIEKNRHEYDADGRPVKAGQTVNGWMTLDFNMDQVDWENDQEFVDAAAEQEKADIVFAQEEKDLKIEQISSVLHLVERSDQEVVDSVEDTDELREENDGSVEGQDAETAENDEAETSDDASEALTAEESIEGAEADKTGESAAIEDDAGEAGETAEKADTTDKPTEEEAGIDKTTDEEETEKEENPADKAASEEEEAAETAEGADTAEEAEDSEEKQPSEPAMPAQSFEETISVKTGTGAYTGKSGALPKKGDILVHVEADEGAFPAGTTMKVSALDRNTQNAVGDAVESAVDARTKGFQAVDIAFFDADGKEIEPLKPIRVSMTSSVISQAADSEHAGETVVVHVDDAGTAQVIGGTGDNSDASQAESAADPENGAVESADVNAGAGISTEAPDQISFDADRFSTYVLVYTVDFHYEVDGKTYQFTLEGGDSTGLSAVLRALSVVEESRLGEFVSNIETVEFSDPELVQVSHRTKTLGIFGTEDWTLKSLKPFDTTESLTVTLLDGETFVIRVTDAQIVTNYLSEDGTSYRITVIYDESAGIPEGAELSVREIEKGTEEFDNYLNQSMDQLGAGDGEVFFARFFDVGIVKDGEKIEPQTPVSVVVEYDQALDLENTDADQMNVVHFADDGMEVIERVSVKDSLDSIAWKQDGFSVTGTILTGAPSNGSNYMVLVEYEGKYYIVNNDGSLTEVDYNTADGTVDVDDPMLWTYTGSNLYHNSIQVDFGSNQCASDYYYRYINPNDNDTELEKENSTIQEDSMAGISADTADNTALKRNSEQIFDWNTWRWSTFNYYTVQTTPGARSEMARAGLSYSNNRIESTAAPGNFVGLEFNEFGTPVRITGRASSENAATIKLAKVGDVLQSQHYLNNTVNHIDISIVGTAAVDIPLAYGKYYNADGEEILNVTEAKSLHLSEDHVGIKTDDMKRARIEAFTLDSNGSKVPLDDAYVISGYSANAETAYSTDQVRIEGVFLVSTDSQPDREIGYDWNYYNSHRDQIWRDRKEKRVYYTVTAIKPITFDLVDPEVGQLYDADGNKMTITVDVAFSASFDYWDPDNECPPLQYNTAWQNGDIPDHNLSGMDFVLGGNPDDINSEILAIEITKLIVDENGNRIKTATPITNTFGVYKDKIHKAIDEAGNLKEIGNETYDVDDYQYLHPKTITISENSDGLGLVYDYEVNEGSAKDGLYLVKEDKDSVPDTIIDKSGNIWNYKKTYFETEYAWRNNSTYDGKVHTSQDYTKDDPELVSKPEVLGRYYEYNGNNVHRNGFLEFFVYNVYESPKVDVPVFKTWNAFEDNKFDWEAEFQLQWAPLNSEGKLTDIFRDVNPAQIKKIKKSDLSGITPAMIQEYLEHMDDPDHQPTTYSNESVFENFTFEDLPKYTTDMNGNAIRIQYSLEELSYEVKEKDAGGNVINTYTWSKEDGYKKNGQPDDDQTNHFEAFYPHDAGEEDEENTDYYVGVANAVRNVREKELVDISLHKEWDSSVEGYQDVNRWAEFELRRYVHTEYRDLSHLTTEDILADPITIQIVDANGHVLDSITAQPNTGLFLAGNFAAHNADKSITFTYPDGGETQTVVVTAEGANASKQLVRSGEFFITEEMLQEQASPAGDRTFTITLTEGADNLVGGANGARILDTSGGTGPLPDRSFSQTVRLDEDNNWTYTWEDLLENETAQGDDDKNENVTCYEYYLVEKGCSPESSAQYYLADTSDPSGITATDMKLGDVDNRIEDGGADSSASIVAINKLAKRLKVEKEWRGVADTTGFPEIRFTLYQGWLSGEGNTATVSTDENDSWPFEHGLERAPANGTTENPTYQDIVLKDGAWEWTCPEDLPPTMKDPRTNSTRNVGYYIKEETTSGSVGSTTWSFYYYTNSNGQQTNDAAQGGETGLSGTLLSENGGSIKVVNRLGSYLPLDIKKKFYSSGENGTWTDTTSANLTDTILGIQLIRAVRTPDGKYLDASGNVVTDPVWTDYGDELLAGYDDSGNKVTRNSGSNDFYIEGGEGDWYFRIRDEQSGSVDLYNDKVGLPANGFYVRNGESISVSYLYSWRESGVYEYEGRDSAEDGGAIHVKASDRVWTSSVTPDVYVDSNGQHALDIDGISTGQTDGSVANFQAAKLKVEKEWIGDNTDAEEIYVKIYRTAAGSDEKEDVTALIAEDIQNNGNRLNALENMDDIDLDHAWLVLKADNWQTGFVTVPVGTRDSLGEYREYSYYIEEVGYKPTGESGADQGTSEVITDVSQFRPVYSRFVNGEWVSAGNNAGENAATADPDEENRFKVTNRTTPSTSYTVTKVFERGYPTDGSAQVTMTLQENYKENESDSGFAGEWQEAASANPVSITLPRPKPAKKPENDPQITSSTALADKEWSEVTDEDWAAVTDQEWYGSAAAWTYTWTGLDITKTIEGGTGSDPTEVPLYYRAQETGGAAWFEPVITGTETPQDQEAGHKAVDDEDTSNSGNEQEHNEITNREASFSLKIDKEWTGLEAGETWPEGFAVDYQLVQHYHLAGAPGGNSGSSVLSGVGPAFKTVEMQKTESGSASEDDDSVHTDAAGTLDERDPEKNIEGLPAYAIFTPTAEDVTEAAAAGVSLTAGEKYLVVYTYSVKETGVKVGGIDIPYEPQTVEGTSVSSDATGRSFAASLSNTLTEVKVRKQWKKGDDILETWPEGAVVNYKVERISVYTMPNGAEVDLGEPEVVLDRNTNSVDPAVSYQPLNETNSTTGVTISHLPTGGVHTLSEVDSKTGLSAGDYVVAYRYRITEDPEGSEAPTGSAYTYTSISAEPDGTHTATLINEYRDIIVEKKWRKQNANNEWREVNFPAGYVVNWRVAQIASDGTREDNYYTAYEAGDGGHDLRLTSDNPSRELKYLPARGIRNGREVTYSYEVYEVAENSTSTNAAYHFQEIQGSLGIGANSNTYTLTNDLTDVRVKKEWEGTDDGTNVTVQLYASYEDPSNIETVDVMVVLDKWVPDGTVAPSTGSVTGRLTGSDGSSRDFTLTPGGGWKQGFSGLPKYDSNKGEITYTVENLSGSDGVTGVANDHRDGNTIHLKANGIEDTTEYPVTFHAAGWYYVTDTYHENPLGGGLIPSGGSIIATITKVGESTPAATVTLQPGSGTNWTDTVNLRKGDYTIAYSTTGGGPVHADGLDTLTVTGNGQQVDVNGYVIEKINVPVNVTGWLDSNNNPTSAPESASIRVKIEGGGVTEYADLSGDGNNWHQTVVLDKTTASGEMIQYSVSIESKSDTIDSISGAHDFSGADSDYAQNLVPKLKRTLGPNEIAVTIRPVKFVSAQYSNTFTFNPPTESNAYVKLHIGNQDVYLNHANGWEQTIVLQKNTNYSYSWQGDGGIITNIPTSGGNIYSSTDRVLEYTAFLNKTPATTEVTINVTGAQSNAVSWTVNLGNVGVNGVNSSLGEVRSTDSPHSKSTAIYRNEDGSALNYTITLQSTNYNISNGQGYSITNYSWSVVGGVSGTGTSIPITVTDQPVTINLQFGDGLQTVGSAQKMQQTVEYAAGSTHAFLKSFVSTRRPANILATLDGEKTEIPITVPGNGELTNLVIVDDSNLPEDAVQVGTPVTLDANSVDDENNSTPWEHMWKNLPKTDANGRPIYYYVVETAATAAGATSASASYSTVTNPDGTTFVTITNTTTDDSEKGKLEVFKEISGLPVQTASEKEFRFWLKNAATGKYLSKVSGIDPAEYEWVDVADPQNEESIPIFTIQESQKYTFNDMPVGNYILKETTTGRTVEHYVFAEGQSVTGTADSGIAIKADSTTSFTFKNVYEPETTSVTVTKEWENADGTTNAPKDGTVTFDLYRNGTKVTDQSITLNGTIDDNEKTPWVAEWTGLRKYDELSGEAYVYTVKEDGDGWEHYTVVYPEDSTPGSDSGSHKDSASDGETITNTENTTRIDVTKQWKNVDEDKVFDEEKTIFFTLWQTYTREDSTVSNRIYTNYNGNGRGLITYHPAVEEPETAAYWDTVEITDLPVKVYDSDGHYYDVSYYVIEDHLEDVDTTYTNGTDTNSDAKLVTLAAADSEDPAGTITIINKDTTTTLTVEKSWGTSLADTVPYSITYHVQHSADNGRTWVDYDSKDEGTDADIYTMTYTPAAEPGGDPVITGNLVQDLPIGGMYRVREISYSITVGESTVTRENLNVIGTSEAVDNSWKSSLTNKLDDITISGSKTWVDNKPVHTDPKLTLRRKLEGEDWKILMAKKEAPTVFAGEYTPGAGGEGLPEGYVNLQPYWRDGENKKRIYTYAGLPMYDSSAHLYTYEVTEDEIPHYETVEETHDGSVNKDFINTEVADLKVRKKWFPGATTKPDIQFDLEKKVGSNGEWTKVGETHTLTRANNDDTYLEWDAATEQYVEIKATDDDALFWAYTFVNLPRFEIVTDTTQETSVTTVEPVIYRVIERKIGDQNVTYTGDDYTGTNVVDGGVTWIVSNPDAAEPEVVEAGEDPTTVMMVNDQEFVSLSGKKTWVTTMPQSQLPELKLSLYKVEFENETSGEPAEPGEPGAGADTATVKETLIAEEGNAVHHFGAGANDLYYLEWIGKDTTSNTENTEAIIWNFAIRRLPKPPVDENGRPRYWYRVKESVTGTNADLFSPDMTASDGEVVPGSGNVVNVNFTNTEQTKIKVKKVWKLNGEETTEPFTFEDSQDITQIKLHLYQLGDSQTELVEKQVLINREGTEGNYTWPEQTVTGLPKYYTKGNDLVMYKYYFVEDEEGLDGWHAAYSSSTDNGQTWSDPTVVGASTTVTGSTGTATLEPEPGQEPGNDEPADPVINEIKVENSLWATELPASGGPGTKHYYVLGTLMTVLAGVWYMMRRRRA